MVKVTRPKTREELKYFDRLMGNPKTLIGDYVTVMNLERGPQGKSLRALGTMLRDDKTETPRFRHLVKFMYRTYIVPEFLETLGVKNKKVFTGNRDEYAGLAFANAEIALISIPTAATAASEDIFDTLNGLLDSRKFMIHQGVVDMTRIEGPNGQLRHDMKRVKIRHMGPNTNVILADIMNASGGSYESAIKEIVKPEHFDTNGSISKIFVAALVSAVEGIERVSCLLNSLQIPSHIVSASIAPELDERHYVRKGPGDAGKRMTRRNF